LPLRGSPFLSFFNIFLTSPPVPSSSLFSPDCHPSAPGEEFAVLPFPGTLLVGPTSRFFIRLRESPKKNFFSRLSCSFSISPSCEALCWEQAGGKKWFYIFPSPTPSSRGLRMPSSLFPETIARSFITPQFLPLRAYKKRTFSLELLFLF